MRRTIAIAALMLICSGCVSYYKITEPGGKGNEYYSTQVESLSTGSVRFKDMRSGGKVTLPASEVKQIKEADLPPDLQPKK